MRLLAVVAAGTVAGLVITAAAAYIYLMGYAPLLEERLHHF